MPLTIPQTQTILQSYFQTGKVPTQDQYAEFIGTMFYLYNGAVAAATAADEAAAAALAATAGTVPEVIITLNFSGGPNVLATQVGSDINVTSLAVNGTFSGTRITFTTPFANAGYKVVTTGGLKVVGAPNANYVDIATALGTPGTGTILIWP